MTVIHAKMCPPLEAVLTHWYIDEHFFDNHTGQWLSQRLHKELWVEKMSIKIKKLWVS